MGLDDDIFQGLQNRETVTVVGGPKAGVGSVSGPLLFPEDPNARQQVVFYYLPFAVVRSNLKQLSYLGFSKIFRKTSLKDVAIET